MGDLETVEFKTMGVRFKVASHARAAAMAKGCGMTRGKWLLACINAGIKADPDLKGGM